MLSSVGCLSKGLFKLVILELGTFSSINLINIRDPLGIIMGPITSWQIDGEAMEQWQTLFWGAPKSLQMVITAMKLKLLLGRKVMTNLDSILNKQRHYFANKCPSSQSYSFSSSHMYGCESWTIMKAECQRIDAFVLWCWRRLLRVPWTEMRSNQSILKEISPEYSLKGLMLKLKLQYFGHVMRRTDSLEKTLIGIAGKDWRW